MFMERSNGYKFFMYLLLLLCIRDAVSAAEACGKDEQCGLMYCGHPCGSRLFIHSGLCLICEAGQYFDFEKTCECQTCGGTRTNNQPNIRGTCMDVRRTVTETPTSLSPSSSLEPPMLPADNVLHITTTSVPDMPKTKIETTADAPISTSPSKLSDGEENSTQETIVAPTQGSGERSPNHHHDILIGVVAVVLGVAAVCVLVALTRIWWRRRIQPPKMVGQDANLERGPNRSDDPNQTENQEGEGEPFVGGQGE